MTGILPSMPLDNTPAFTNGLRAPAPDKSQYKQWDFLKGDSGTPSSSERYYDPLEKKSFKPGWSSMRHIEQIKPYEQRLAQQAERQARHDQTSATHREHVKQRSLQGAFNPITGNQYDAASQSWQPANDPWAHRKPSLRPEHTCRATYQQQGATASAGIGGGTGTVARTQALASVADMRRQRIASDGLTSTKRPTGGVKELMQWGS
mmetsp:Transcript_22959/g.58680  ORF Transcript_22959/g.58680 Transcript_22959/m.58680 type:complete len:206 (-) Transcript_22959:345-962(-)|eukprot:CAMPEP_0202870178 /NCGR_PEP_ID=MMETSP1391-20130828/14884_1 /ASSEMBLY_ACC=CAM_ASM_000867 /TAXON_ID=1034604 /ORGANISM="Chlamydomonas leiostraca, Strain SAG 11-49" /LENGTH=205 /DNA_ID=CAMNT_0049550679 /DNA_START=45 /DNA_END=662 /DNA_ORIENTATION=+